MPRLTRFTPTCACTEIYYFKKKYSRETWRSLPRGAREAMPVLIMSVWIPSTVSNVLVNDHLRMQLEYPQYFSAQFPPTSCWFVVGRPGLRKHEAVKRAIEDAQLPCQVLCTDVSLDDEKHPLTLGYVRDILKAAAAAAPAGAAAVVIINRGHLLCSSRYPGVTEEFNHWPALLKGRPNVVLLICSDVPLRDFPQTTKIAYQYQQQIFFPCPDDVYRAKFFREQFAEYRKLIEKANRIRVLFPQDMDAVVELLVESSPYTTTDELEGYMNKLVRSVHKLDKDPVELNEDYCTRYLIDKGGVYNLSEADGYAQEQMFLSSAGIRGIPPLPERTPKTITNQKLYDNGGIERNLPPPAPQAQAEAVPDESKIHDWGERITFDKKGKPVVLSDTLEKDVMEPEKKKQKGKKRRH